MLPRKQSARSILSGLSCTCRRQASTSARKHLIPVELLQLHPRYGPAGSRVSVSRGLMRNLLYPKGLAAYVVEGQAVPRMPIFGLKPVKEVVDLDVRTKQALEADEAKAIAKKAQELEESSLLLLRKSFLGLPPIVFKRRAIRSKSESTADRNAEETSGESISRLHLHGSVTPSDVLDKVKRDHGIIAGSARGEFVVPKKAKDGNGQEWIQNGRVKYSGRYKLDVLLDELSDPVSITVVVEPQ